MHTHANHPRSWKEALLALVTPRHVSASMEATMATRNAARCDSATEPDDEREAFHLDDTGIPARIQRDRGLVHYGTPPHAHLVFPTLTSR